MPAPDPRFDTPPPEPTPPAGSADPSPDAPAQPAATHAVLERTSEQMGRLRDALTLRRDDPFYVGALKIAGMIVSAVLLLALSPLIILGLAVGLAAAA